MVDDTHWVAGTVRDDTPTPDSPWLRMLAVVLLVVLIDGLLGLGLGSQSEARSEPRLTNPDDEPVTRTRLRASLQAAVDDPGRPILLLGDSVLAGDVLAPLRSDWQDQRILDHLGRELAQPGRAAPALQLPGPVSFHQIALDGLLPIDMLHLITELDRLDPGGRVEVVIELNLRYFSAQYAKQDECTRAALCSLADSALGDSGPLVRSVVGLGEVGTIVHDWLLARTPIHRFRPALARPPALERVTDLAVARSSARPSPSEREALARMREHYRSSNVRKGNQADAFGLLLDRLHARRPALMFVTPLAPAFARAALPGNERPRRYSELATEINQVASTPGQPLELINLDHPLFVDQHFIDHVHLQPEGNRLLAINLLHQLALPLAQRPSASALIHDEDHDQTLVHRTDGGWADGSAWTVLFDHPEGIAVSRDGSQVVIADTNNHALRLLRGNMQFVERLAGRPKRAGQRDGVASMALLDHPRDPELVGDQVWFIDGADQDQLRVLDHGSVRSVGWQGVRCPTFERISAASSEPQPDPVLFVLCRDQRVLALDLGDAKRPLKARVVVRPEPADRFVAIEALPDGSICWPTSSAKSGRSTRKPNPGRWCLPTPGTRPCRRAATRFRSIEFNFARSSRSSGSSATARCWSPTSSRRSPTASDSNAS